MISYCEAVERVEFAGSDCYFMAGSFEGCANLKYIKLPHRLERIPDNMFRNCSSLKEIIIPSTVKSIGKNAFDGCSKLTSVVFEESSKLESIGCGAFKGCSGLSSMNFGYTNYWYYTSSLENAANKTGGEKFDLNLTNVELVKKYADYYWYKKM